MVERYLKREHRFVCLTDRPRELPDWIETAPAKCPQGCKAWWAKTLLFKPGQFECRVLYLDLDVLVVADITEIVDYPAPFALAPDASPDFHPVGYQTVKRFNSSVMVWDAGVASELFTEWTPAIAKRLWGDQDAVGERFPDAATMPKEWFPRLSEVPAKTPKNHIAAARHKWFAEAWG